tara:strand:+ start:1245 stop:1874 length:630 start_codon:yes stop_codon:yes gene_type:complete
MVEFLEHYLSLATKAIFIENILLAYFLGMCSFLALSNKVETASGIGKAVIFVNAITVPLNWLIKTYLLDDGALAWTGISAFSEVNLSFLTFIAFIATIAAAVQLVEMIMDRFSPSLYNKLGIFLPLIAVNCAILGSSIFMQQRDYTFLEAIVFAISSGFGWYLAILTMSTIRYKLRYSNIPNGLRGLGITMILTGLLAIAFLSFSGINL